MFKRIFAVMTAVAVGLCTLGCSCAIDLSQLSYSRNVADERAYIAGSLNVVNVSADDTVTTFDDTVIVSSSTSYGDDYRSSKIYDTFTNVVVNTSLVRIRTTSSHGGTPIPVCSYSSSCVLSLLNLSFGDVQLMSVSDVPFVSMSLTADLSYENYGVVNSYVTSPSSSTTASFKYPLDVNFGSTQYATFSIGGLSSTDFVEFLNDLNYRWSTANGNNSMLFQWGVKYNCLIPTSSISGVGYYAIPCVVDMQQGIRPEKIKSYVVSSGRLDVNIVGNMPFVSSDIDSYTIIALTDDKNYHAWIYFPYSSTGSASLPYSIGTYYSKHYVEEVQNGNDSYSNGYSSGFESGYYVGHTDGYAEGKVDGAGDGYNVGKNQGYIEGYQEGAANANKYTFMGLIGAVFDAPISAFKGLLNFEVLGVNLSSFALSLLTFAIIVKIIGLVLGNG